MKTVLKTSIAALLSFATTPALAQSAYPDGFSAYGTVSVSTIGSTGSGGSNETIGYGNFGLSWDFGGNFGVDYSTFGFAVGGSDSRFAHYLAVAYNMGGMRFSVGAPRAAFDRYGHFRLERTTPLYGGLIGSLFQSTVTVADLDGDYRSYGVRLDGESASGLSYAVSLHAVDGLQDSMALSASAEYALASDVIVTGGVDYFDYDSAQYTKAKLGIAKDFGRFDAAFNIAYFDDPSFGQVTAYEISGSYDVTDKFNVGLGYFDYSDSSSSALITADASYRFYQGAAAFASLSKSPESGSSDALYTVGLRYDF